MQDIVSEDLHKNPKRFWSYIKSRKQESSGITSLKNKDSYLHSDTVSKADPSASVCTGDADVCSSKGDYGEQEFFLLVHVC
jgi:hypothetical protein